MPPLPPHCATALARAPADAPTAPRAGPIVEAAPAKINLWLHVTGRRDDGYHTLDSLAVFADVGERVSAMEDRDLSVAVTGPFAQALAAAGGESLVLRAAEMIALSADAEEHVVPVFGARGARLVVAKHIPVAAGLGGGSADAAAALLALRRHWRLEWSAGRLLSFAERLGADVPACLAGRPVRMGGIGEALSPAPDLPPTLGLVLAHAGVPCPTPAVFRARSGAFSQPADPPARFADARGLAAWLATQSANDLEATASALVPAIPATLAALRARPEVLLARMSGSGAACFALTPDPETAGDVAAVLAASHPRWWLWGGALAPPRG
ncbi:MAG: 4-(cytidine 5'-diphospho)-2-C-methyl-D-erythritol kinase [Alphaproteobacteria bacterium]|nr:4-(cytidine 5'-diphospho)-2-C-methyl-D-erythritol kinase [Alphaproteobacteria bacterium]